MGLGLYTAADPATLVSKDDTFTNPLLLSMDGKIGGVLQKKVYLRNDDAARSYINIQVTPVYAGDPDFIDNSQGISWKLISGDVQPTDDSWALVTSSPNTIVMGDIGTLTVSDTTTFLPFWIRTVIPRFTDIQTIRGIKLTVVSDEVLI